MIRFFVLALSLLSMGASYRTPNFIVTTQDAHFAKEAAETAEKCRRELAVLWLGKELPTWSAPCPVSIQAGPNLGAGGATSFTFNQGEVVGWRMNIQGSRERLLDAVIPHEVTHTIFASHFRQPLPRWADEGACTTVESEPELSRQRQLLDEFWRSRRCLPFPVLFAMKDYPSDVLPLYAQGWSVTQFLLHHGSRPYFVAFLTAGLSSDWASAVRDHYGYQNLNELQTAWNGWLSAGAPNPDEHVAAYQGGRYWNGRAWVQSGGCANGQCGQPSYSQPTYQNPPAYAGPSAPTVPVAKPPTVQPPAQQPLPEPPQVAKGCQCTGEGKCECDPSKLGCKCDGAQACKCGDLASVVANIKAELALIQSGNADCIKVLQAQLNQLELTLQNGVQVDPKDLAAQIQPHLKPFYIRVVPVNGPPGPYSGVKLGQKVDLTLEPVSGAQ